MKYWTYSAVEKLPRNIDFITKEKQMTIHITEVGYLGRKQKYLYLHNVTEIEVKDDTGLVDVHHKKYGWFTLKKGIRLYAYPHLKNTLGKVAKGSMIEKRLRQLTTYDD